MAHNYISLLDTLRDAEEAHHKKGLPSIASSYLRVAMDFQKHMQPEMPATEAVTGHMRELDSLLLTQQGLRARMGMIETGELGVEKRPDTADSLDRNIASINTQSTTLHLAVLDAMLTDLEQCLCTGKR